MSEPTSALSQYLSPLPERPTVTEALVQQILSLIREAALKPGDRLPSEKEIIEATNASRPSVREALRALKTMGIITTRPGAGSFLGQPAPAALIRPEVMSLVLMGEGLCDILEARKVLECHVARLAARCSRDELAPVEAVLDKMRSQTDSGEGMDETTWAFHMAVADAAGNPVVAKLVRILYEMIHEIHREWYWPYTDFQEELASHEKLYRAILEGETEADLEMHKHIDRVASIMGKALDRASTSGDHSKD